MTDTDLAVTEHLPLTSVEFEIMLAVADRERHGYSIILDVERRTGGAVRLRPGTLYRALNRMLETGFLRETLERPDPEIDDRRRRYYQLTALGRRVAAAEAERLALAVKNARAKNLLHSRHA
jgi:DNA-binding PadR family transcriptional regulator